VSVARFIADQRSSYRVPHTMTCTLLGVSLAWFYKWLGRASGPSAASGLHTPRDRRRDTIDGAVRVMFTKKRGLHGSPRLHADLRDDGWQISEKTVADSMRRQGLVARRIKRRNGLTKQDKTAPKFPDLLKRNFTADRPNARWVGDMTEIPTAAGKLYLATVIDLYSRRLLGAATSLHPDAELACAAIKMAVAARGGTDVVNGPGWRTDESRRVIFHTDRGSTYTANSHTKLCRQIGVRQSMGRVGSSLLTGQSACFCRSATRRGSVAAVVRRVGGATSVPHGYQGRAAARGTRRGMGARRRGGCAVRAGQRVPESSAGPELLAGDGSGLRV
jgi:putative transposase